MAKKYSYLTTVFGILTVVTFTQIINIESALARPKEYSVFEIRKTLPLSENEPVYRDYYINMGTDDGLRVGNYVSVHRHSPVIDIYRNKAQDDLIVPLAHMKVIHAQKTMSVARVVSHTNPEQIPVVQFEQVMLGDRVELVEGDLPSREVAAAKPEAQAEAKPEVKVSPKESKPQTKPEVKAESKKAAPKTESKPVAQGPTDLTTTRN
jgi:hypothetical protein